MSGLFWWSALTKTIFLPSTVPPKSAIAILAASARALAGHVGIQARHVVDVTDDHLVGGRHGSRRRESGSQGQSQYGFRKVFHKVSS